MRLTQLSSRSGWLQGLRVLLCTRHLQISLLSGEGVAQCHYIDIYHALRASCLSVIYFHVLKNNTSLLTKRSLITGIETEPLDRVQGEDSDDGHGDDELDREDGVDLPDETQSDALLGEGAGQSPVATIFCLRSKYSHLIAYQNSKLKPKKS